MESDEGIDTNELNTVLFKSKIKPPADITEKFNELDTNKNGRIEESEITREVSESEISSTFGRRERRCWMGWGCGFWCWFNCVFSSLG